MHYLSFIRTFITTDSIKRAVEKRQLELQQRIQSKAEAQASSATQSQEKKAQKEISAPLKQQLNQIEATLRKKSGEVSINELKTEENKIAENVPSIDSAAIATLNAVQKTITPPVVTHKEETYSLVGDPATKWCKAGYFVEFNNTLRISVTSVNAGTNTITVDLKDVETNDDNPPIIRGNITIASGETIIAERNGYRYQVTLNYIGGAGRNPFTKAGYITVATYKKG